MNAAPWLDRVPSTGDNKTSYLTQLRQFIRERWGIVFDEHQHATLQTRLQRRYREMGLRSLEDYCAFLFEQGGMDGELSFLSDAVTTNTTSFFREERHFEYLTDVYLPACRREGTFRTRPLRAWSAASSIGQEAYTLAIVLTEYNRLEAPLDFQILGTDLSVRALTQLKNAVYPEEDVRKLPLELRTRYFLRGKDGMRDQVRVVSDLRRRVSARRLNLTAPPYSSIPPDFDLILIRNCLIYFDAPTRLKVVRELRTHLRPGGLLMTGHSEHFSASDIGMEIVGPSLYRKYAL